MQKGILLLAYLLSCCIFGNSQTNLVPNPGFEAYAGCPNGGSNPMLAVPWIQMQLNTGTYANVCANANLNPKAIGVPYNYFAASYNYQYAHTGNGYAGFLSMNANWYTFREFKIYQGVKLKRSLSTKCYYAEFYVSLVNQCKLATNNIGMYITTDIQTADTNSPAKYYIPANPQVLNYNNPIIKDTQNWVRVSGVFSAVGGEQYITIGNFKHDTATAIDSFNVASYVRRSGYCLDDVAVYDLDSIPQSTLAGRDTSIALGDSVFIGSNSGGLQNAIWYNSSGAVINTGIPGFWVKPTASTYYVLQLAVCTSLRQDTVRVNVGTTPLKFLKFEVRSTNETAGSIPLLGGVRGGLVENIWQTANEINVSHFNIQRSVNGIDFTSIGKLAANNKSYNEYRYTDDHLPLTVDGSLYYRIESVDKDGRKDYSETRTLNLKPQTLNSVSIFPNPAKEQVTIECKGAKELMIIDYLGRVVYREIATGTNLRNDAINIKQFSKGIYVVKAIMSNGDIKTEKLVIE